MAPHGGAVLPAEHLWKSRGLGEQHFCFLGQKEHHLALGSGGKSWRAGFLPALCDTEMCFCMCESKGLFISCWTHGV